jgi:hypothetical protein
MEMPVMKTTAPHDGTLEMRKPAFSHRRGTDMEVQEEEHGAIKAQSLYKLRCECGRSWFELELPKLMKCPACAKLGLVSI